MNDSIRQQREIGLEVDGDNNVRQEAADFVARRLHSPPIPSIDDLEAEVIDAEWSEVEGSNVRKFPGA
jgi:hypothetical protein